MKTSLLAAIALVSFVSTASAAELGAPIPKSFTDRYQQPAAFSWTGFYAGVNAGGSMGALIETPTNDLDVISSRGWFAGGQVGVNYQIGNVVLGIESDAQMNNAVGTRKIEYASYYYECGWLSCTMTPYTSSNTKDVSLDWFGTTRLRLGYAIDNVLPYITGGVAYGGLKTTDTYRDPWGEYVSTASGPALGYTIGGGVEWAFAKNWSAKAEYLFLDLGVSKFETKYSTASVDMHDHVYRLGVNFKF